jgi:superfamily I DNA/RNA helicase
LIKLTEKQKDIKNQDGIFVVKACAGSGKTIAVAARFADLYKSWKYTNRGIAVLSFTNVAWKEIEKFLFTEFRIEEKASNIYPHFLGSIDSFINRYLFLPFGHIIMNCEDRPKFTGPPYNDWDPVKDKNAPYYYGKAECNQNNCKINNISYNVNHELQDFSSRPHFPNCGCGHQSCKRVKEQLYRNGYVTQLDANYFVMRILEKYNAIAKALVYRFPVLMLDEAQDTSEVQMKIVDLLIDNGLKEVMFIGDPDQAIYEWRTAKPQLFVEKFEHYHTISLNESLRSSQKICNFIQNLSSLNCKIRAINDEVKDFDFVPEIWGYNGNCYDEIIENFISLCREKEIKLNNENIAILARSEDLLKKISGITSNVSQSPWKDIFTKEIAKSKYLYTNGNYYNGFNSLEKAVFKKIKDSPTVNENDKKTFIDRYGFKKWRKNIGNIMCKVSETNCKLGDWVEITKTSLKDIEILDPLEIKIKGGIYKKIYNNLSFDELFKTESKQVKKEEYILGTIHSVKGETFEAVLLILKERTTGGKYIKLLSEDINNCEELRNVYVAITRPKKILVIAVPEKDRVKWENKFYN